MRAHRAVVATALAVFACKSEVRYPEPESASAYFERYVVPELERRCAAPQCHGVPLEQYTAKGPGWFKLPTDEGYKIRSRQAIDLAYAESTGRVQVAADRDPNPETVALMKKSASLRVDRHAEPIFSDFIRKLVPESLGGVPHRGGDNYLSLRDGQLAHLMRWIELERTGDPEPVSALEARFRDEVQPALHRKGCFVASCHGPFAGSILKFSSGVNGRFSAHMTHDNYKTALGMITVNATREHDSRLLKKALAPSAGGIVHRGSNQFFTGPDDPDLVRIQRWIRAEGDAARLEKASTGVVYVDRPPSKRDYFDVGAWTPGAELVLLAPIAPDGRRSVLTAPHHTAPIDVRTPEVSPDGREILFAMRRSVDDCLNIYRIGADGSDLRALTADTGCREASWSGSHINAANLSPLYSPNGLIYFISTRGKVMADKGRFPSTNMWAMKPDGSELRQITFGHNHEVDLSMATKSGKAIMLITAPRDIGLQRHGALYFVPPDWWTDYHPFFGEQSKYPLFAQSSELLDFRTVLSLQHWDNLYQGGALAVFDRNVGPDIEQPELMASAAYPAFVRALGVMSPDAVALGAGPGPLYRDPVATSDGRLVVSTSSAAVDPLDPNAAVDYDLVLTAVETDPVTRMPKLGAETVLVGDPDRWAVEAAILTQRVLPKTKPSYLRKNLPRGTGLIQFYDAFTLETILRDNRPTGRADKVLPNIAGLRAVFGKAMSAPDSVKLDPARVRNGDPESTRVSNGIHSRRRAAGPLPVARDGSVYFRLPALEAFLLQTIDAEGYAIGMHYDRWLFLSDGEAFGNGVTTHTYDLMCGGCHGSYSGKRHEGFAGFDTISSASVTLATHLDSETRRDPIDGTAPAMQRGVSFKAELDPLFRGKCASSGCHDGAHPLDLSAGTGYSGPYSNAYESLMKLGTGSGDARAGRWQKEYVDEREARARRSHLMEKLHDRELDAPKVLSRGGCRAATAFEAGEKAKVALWIDLGATFLGWDDP